ncbi:hypothetical protein P154DRAFT_312822 [Amniculicola lignicola CBS 123094]|uniref:Uncharacterized protein n=1 Tax=Amniculicola lignicola CBS 123094 TaxID=1392246 RepID=A0A6A5WZE6_9PLEO|nr:hypothetical protein P154DRAFT_312822 [Amniculicola lignicola CBS 123094]
MSNPTSRPFTRPAFPPLQPTSTASSQNGSAYQSFQSSTSNLSSPSSAASAPLPSPSATRPQHQDFFASLNQQQHTQQSQSHQQQTRMQAQQQSQAHNPWDYRPNREGAGRTAAETGALLDHSALLAEAAKRAQMAVLMRDIDSMEL